MALAAIAPPRCAACDAPVDLRAVFCAACAATLRPGDARAAFVYGGAVATAITRFKYERRPDLARPLAHLLMRVTRAIDPPDLVVPVPLHPSRLAERGYNQAALLARPVAADFGARFAPTALVRTRDTPHQAHLDRAARAANVDGAFGVRRDVRARDVLVIDDVVTTGATVRACMRALLDAGAARVRAVAVAYAEG